MYTPTLYVSVERWMTNLLYNSKKKKMYVLTCADNVIVHVSLRKTLANLI